MYTFLGITFDFGALEELVALAHTLDLTPGPGGSRMADFARAYAAYQACGPLRDAFPDRWSQVTVIALEPSAQIVVHTDAPVAGRRIHVPLQQNSLCWTFAHDRWLQLRTGSAYRMDPTVPHGAVNWGTTRRLHLILDVDWR